jgi:hypothetical protein
LADAFVASLPANPLRLIAAEVHLGTGAFRGAIAEAHKRLPALAAGDDVMLALDLPLIA